MKTRDEIIAAVRMGRKSDAIDGRDYSRLMEFFPVENWKDFGFELKEGAEQPQLKELTRENVCAQLMTDLDFAFEKALNKRGISASCMYAVIKMWMWVLDDSLQYFSDYAQYGLPLFRAVALKYGLPNPIGNDEGNEPKYSSEE